MTTLDQPSQPAAAPDVDQAAGAGGNGFSLPPGVFSNSLAMILTSVALTQGWYVAAGVVIAIPVFADRRPPEWQSFGVAGGLCTVVATVAQADRHPTASLAFLAAGVLSGLAAALFGRKAPPAQAGP